MPTTEEFTTIPRKDLHIFYILDTSGSMEGTRIAQLNRAVEETRIALADIAKKNGDANIKIAILEYNSEPNWVTKYGPEPPEGFIFDKLVAGGLTEIGAALKELDSKLSRNEFLESMTGALMPVLIFMTDGFATDDPEELYKALENIQHNKWFKKGTKIGFAIGDDADRNLIAQIVGNPEAVIQTDDLDLFAKLIRFVSVSASMLASSSRTTEVGTSAGDIVKTALEEQDVNPQEVGIAPTLNIDTSVQPSNQQIDDFDDDEGNWNEDDWL